MALPGLACAHCGTVGALSSTIFSRYLHLFWIPVLPIGKTSVTVCQHCQQTLREREMPAAYRAPVQALQAQARTPFSNYALLLLFGAGLALVLVGGIVGRVTGAGRPAAATPPPATAATEAREDDEPAAQANTLAAALAEDEPIELKAGARYKFKASADGQLYGLVQVNKVTADSVYYRMTHELHGKPSDAVASLALRDSVLSMDANRSMTKEQWHFSTTGQGMFRRFD